MPLAGSRSELFRVRMHRAELAMLRDLASRDGITASDIVRMLVRREHGKRTRRAASNRVVRSRAAVR
jgi:hypothetical protein